ncbi:MAG: aminotransferase class III-fold pyridoxal phosphate-dependent enzyme [Trueperaceae bacterium]
MTPTDPQTNEAGPATRDLLQRDARHHSGLWSPRRAFVAGDGCTLIDADGNRFLDLMAGIAVASLGHAHPELTHAIAAQAGRLISAPQNLASDVRTEFQEALFRLAPAPLNRVFLSSSGSEANEAAVKWARAATGRSTFVAFKRGFHGRTLGALPLTWTAAYREPFEPLLGSAARFVPYGDAGALAEALDGEVAALVMEPIQGEGGIHPADQAFVQEARRLTRDAGALLIFDEIQSGAGRTGRFLAHQHFGVDADVVTMAKGLGGGVPIGATLMTDQVAGAMPAGGHGTTFGGNPLSAAAGLVVLRALEDGLLEHVADVGGHLHDRLNELAQQEPRIRTVRGMGLMVGVEFKEKVAGLVEALERRGIVAIAAGATVIRFVPPLIISKAEIDRAVDGLRQALADTAPEA